MEGIIIKGKYRVGPHIGHGGMGHVYRGQSFGAEGFFRPVACKMLRSLCADEPRMRALFAHEARVCASLQHRNIVSVLDFECTDNGQLVLVMEYVDGLDLGHLARSGPLAPLPPLPPLSRLPIGASVRIVIEVLRALAYAHERGIVHRDIKPRNVLVSRAGEVKLTDFGMAKIADQSSVDVSPGGQVIKGTVGYISPEVVQHQDIDARADLFMVGVMLYELLTGRMPFGNDGIGQTVARMLAGPPIEPREVRAEIPDDLNAIIMRLLRRDRDERYPCARDVIDALRADSVRAHTLEQMAEIMDERMEHEARERAERAKDPDATERLELVASSGPLPEIAPRAEESRESSRVRMPTPPRRSRAALLALACMAGMLMVADWRDNDGRRQPNQASQATEQAEPTRQPEPAEPEEPPEPTQAASTQPTPATEPTSNALAGEAAHADRSPEPGEARPRARRAEPEPTTWITKSHVIEIAPRVHR